MCEFQVGDMVVCINDIPDVGQHIHLTNGSLDGLKKGAVYTVREVYIHIDNVQCPDGEICIKLVEIIRPVRLLDKQEHGYFWHRFRPVKKTSIDCFTSILTKAPTIREQLDA